MENLPADGDELEARAIMPSEIKALDLDRVTVDFRIHKEHCCDDPTTIPAQFSAFLKSKGVQVYSRNIKVSTKKSSLDLGWIQSEGAEVGMVVVKHLPFKRQTLLQKAQKLPEGEIKPPDPILEIYCKDSDKPDFELLPDQFVFGPVADVSKWLLRVTSGVANVQQSLFPK